MDEKPKIIDERRFKLEEITREGFIPMFGGRPIRDNTITKDELLNLKIILNTTNIDEFLKSI